ncbi:hypothetical protein P4307_13220 [Brevibacillus porteri]|uniref:hypothetical protein n=1 Tax=Brevibacillus porteri TaxID=2126350 RepID=UPI002E1F8D08|nr:hypothetical protein [Brevibacillus porteri]
MHLVKKVALVVEEAHFQSTLRPPPLKGYNCPLRNKWRERFKPENAKAFLYVIKAENPRHLFLRWGGLQRRLDWKAEA